MSIKALSRDTTPSSSPIDDLPQALPISIDAVQPVSPAPLPAGPRRYPWWHWRRLGFNFLTISIAAHLLFGVAATYLIVQTIQAKRKQTFAGPPSSPNAPTRALEHKVQMQKKQQTMSAPVMKKRITTTSSAKVAMPAMPAMPTMDSAITPMAMAGMGGSGMGLGMGGSSGGGGGGGSNLSFFGLHTNTGLAGTLYDLKQTNDRQPTPIAKGDMYGEGVPIYNALVQRFVRGGWNADLFAPYFRAPTVLYTNRIYVPNAESGEAAKAFNVVEQVQGDRWLVLYKGRVKAPKDGTFRFIGRGDNVLIVRLDTRLIFDGSQPVLIPEAVAANAAVGPGGGPGWQMAAGPWFNVSQGQEMDIQIIIGDTGGLFSDFLLIEEKGAQYVNRKDASQFAAYPLFQTNASAPPSGIENKTSGLNPEVAAAPVVFQLVVSRFGAGF